MHELKIFAGRASRNLGKKICEALEIELGKCKFKTFADREIWMKYEDNIRGRDVFLIQSTNPPVSHLFELLMMIDAARRASAYRITAVIPYFGYARQDRKDKPRVPITAKLVANLLEKSGADRILTMDLHTPQIQGFFDIPVDHLYGSGVFLDRIKKENLKNLVIASPDVGGIKTARAYSKLLNAELVVIDKRRTGPDKSEVMNVIGNVKGKNVFIIDDIIDTGTTFTNAVEALIMKKAVNIYGVGSHPVLSKNAHSLIKKSKLKKLFVTDSIPVKKENNKIEVISISKMIAEAIWKIHKDDSLSSMFPKDYN